MSALEPAPSMMVVFSFSMRTRLARPSMLRVMFSSLMPRSSDTAVPPVRIAMSSSMALRRSPKPGAFTAATLQAAAQLVDHQGRERLALDVLGHDQQRTAGLHHGLEDGQHGLERRELLLVDQDVGVVEFGDHLLGVGDEV